MYPTIYMKRSRNTLPKRNVWQSPWRSSPSTDGTGLPSVSGQFRARIFQNKITCLGGTGREAPALFLPVIVGGGDGLEFRSDHLRGVDELGGIIGVGRPQFLADLRIGLDCCYALARHFDRKVPAFLWCVHDQRF